MSLDPQVNTLLTNSTKSASEHTIDGVQIHRHVRTTPATEPFLELDSSLEKSTDIFAWSDPESSVEFLARGRRCGILSNGPERFQEAQSFCSQARELINTKALRDSSLPFIIGGFAFADHSPAASWAGWASANLWVPEEIIWTDGTRTLRVEYSLSCDAPQQRSTLKPLQTIPATTSFHHKGCSSTPSTQWKEQVQNALTSIEKNELQKVVLARSLELEAGADKKFDIAKSALALRNQHRACTQFVIRSAQGSVFLGASPETLLRRKGALIESQALAGTDQSAETLKASQKDQREHQYVVEAIVKRLSELVDLDSHNPEPQLHALKDLVHFETRIKGTATPDVDNLDLLKALHPTPAVGGLPKEPAMKWIERHEELERGWYAGPVGWLGTDSDAHFVVAIRSVLTDGSKAESFTGAGIVENSTPSKEWEETSAKSQTVVESLQIRADGASTP